MFNIMYKKKYTDTNVNDKSPKCVRTEKVPSFLHSSFGNRNYLFHSDLAEITFHAIYHKIIGCMYANVLIN